MNAVINIAKEPLPAIITSFAKLHMNIPKESENNDIASVSDLSFF